MRMRTATQAGFTLVTTIFLLVVVSALGGYLVQLATAQHISSALTTAGVRAHYALTSGLEWLAYELNASAACPALPASVTVEGYQVSVTACTAHAITEGPLNYQLFDVTLNAERGSFGNADYTNVRLQATLSD